MKSAGAAACPILQFPGRIPGCVRAVKQVPGGMIDPGKMVSGLARAAEKSGAQIFENVHVEEIEFTDPVCLRFPGGQIRARKVLLATNGMSLELSDLASSGANEIHARRGHRASWRRQLESLGLASGRPFYTIDFPYLWGRNLRTGGVVFGGGLVHMNDWRELLRLGYRGREIGGAHRAARIPRPRAAPGACKMCASRTEWGGPILIANEWRPVFARHPRSPHAIVLGAYSGHGVAQSVYLGRWAAEVMCGKDCRIGIRRTGFILSAV